MKKNKARYRKLHRIYEQVPSMNCKGLCHDECTSLGMTKYEADQMTRAGQRLPTVDENLVCTYLVDRKCTIYNDRPLVCRLFGHVNDLPCVHGCVPDRIITEAFATALLNETAKEFGAPAFNTTITQLQEFLEDKENENDHKDNSKNRIT